MKAMILAAGLGTRLRPITEKYAKPAVPFLNIPLLYYSLELMRSSGQIDGLVLNTHHHPEQIEALAMRIQNLDVAFSHEPGTPLGSGGGIWKARAHLEGTGDFLVANGDEVILPHDPQVMKTFIAKHVASGALATILTMRHPLVGTQFGGVWADRAGNVRGFGKDGSLFGPDVEGFHYIGLLLLSDRVFKYLPEGESNILYDALVKGIKAGEKVETLVSNFTWYETGNPIDFLNATREAIELLATGNGEDANSLRAICREYWSDEFHLDGKLVLPRASKVKPNIQGFGVIGSNVRIGTNTDLQNVVLLRDAIVPNRPIANEILF